MKEQKEGDVYDVHQERKKDQTTVPKVQRAFVHGLFYSTSHLSV